MLILVLEASTASAKAMLYSHTQGIIGTLQRNYSSAAGDTLTFDADLVMAETLATARDLLTEFGVTTVDLISTCSIWSHSLLLLTPEKRPVSRLSTWADTSASSTTREYRRDFALYNSLYQRTGCPIHVTYTLWKYIHERDAGRAPQTGYISSMPEYLFYTLTNELAVSKSTASAGGLLNIHSLEWDTEALRLAGLAPERLPQLVPSEYTAPLTAQAATSLGLPAGTPVLVTGADGCMHHVAAGAFAGNVLTLSVGTSAALRLAADRVIVADTPSTWCYVGVEGMWVVGSAIAGAGNCIDWMGKKILSRANGGEWGALEQNAHESMRHGRAPIFLPFLVGERSPGWDDARKGALCDLELEHTSYDLFYAVLEGVLFNLKQCYDLMRPMFGQEITSVNISGGIEASPLWLSMAASLLGLSVQTNENNQASLLGAAMLGLKAGGLLDSVKHVQPIRGVSIEPNAEVAGVLNRRYEVFLGHYNRFQSAERKGTQ
ncbi:MAG: Xylulose kinase [Firmicutes bacterium]|nr:Xylulose kinase [candidate division NPL-UPA2 bacterium]